MILFAQAAAAAAALSADAREPSDLIDARDAVIIEVALPPSVYAQTGGAAIPLVYADLTQMLGAEAAAGGKAPKLDYAADFPLAGDEPTEEAAAPSAAHNSPIDSEPM